MQARAGETHKCPYGSSWTCTEQYQAWEWNESLKMSPFTNRYLCAFLAQVFMGYRAQRAMYCRMWISFKWLSTSSGKDLSDMEMPLEWRAGDSEGDETKYFYADSSVQQWGSRLQTGDALWEERTGSQLTPCQHKQWLSTRSTSETQGRSGVSSEQIISSDLIWKATYLVSTLDLRCHWEHFMFPTDGCGLHAATMGISPNLRPLHSTTLTLLPEGISVPGEDRR